MSAQHPAIEAPSAATLTRSIALMTAATLASQLLISAGPIAVKVLASSNDAAAGRFLTTLVVARVPLFLFSALQASLLPGLAKLAGAGQYARMVASVRRTCWLLAGIGAALTALLAIAGPSITALVFGPGYRADPLPLGVLALGCTAYMLASVVAQAVLALHLSGSVAVGWWLGVAVFVAMLVPRIDLPLRVSAGLLVGSVVAGVWFVVVLRRQTGERRRVVESGPVRSHLDG
jgi:O-antigen/teichoic acid export membrane protein